MFRGKYFCVQITLRVIAWQVYMPATKVDSLTLIPETYLVQGENWLLKLPSDHHMCASAHAYPQGLTIYNCGWLELSVDQASPKHTQLQLPLSSSAGIKGICHLHPAIFFFHKMQFPFYFSQNMILPSIWHKLFGGTYGLALAVLRPEGRMLLVNNLAVNGTALLGSHVAQADWSLLCIHGWPWTPSPIQFYFCFKRMVGHFPSAAAALSSGQSSASSQGTTMK